MPALTDFYQPAAGNPLAQQFRVADINSQITGQQEDAGLAQSRMSRQFFQQTLPGLTNRDSARGTVRGGQHALRMGYATADYNDRYGDVSRQVNRSVADLLRARLAAQLGIGV